MQQHNETSWKQIEKEILVRRVRAGWTRLIAIPNGGGHEQLFGRQCGRGLFIAALACCLVLRGQRQHYFETKIPRRFSE
jgi:hypothetical protein